MDESQIEHIVEQAAKRAAKEAVRETLSGLGFAMENPRDIQADLLYLQKIRKGSEFMALRVKASVIAVLIPTFLYMLWEVVRESVTK